jgi:deoxyribonuclease-1
MPQQLLLLIAAFFLPHFSLASSAPETFDQAKLIAKNTIYFDHHQTFYCGCSFEFMGKTGGRTDLASCGYAVRKNQSRSERIEYEHIVPASNFGRARQCWQNGGRSNCTANDPVFSRMEANLFNLTIAVGEANGDRSNFNFGQVSGIAATYGQCDFQVDFKNRVAEPRDEIKGMIARTYFYMFDSYAMNMSASQQRMMIAWDKQYPVSDWEQERHNRVATIMGHTNQVLFGV